MSEIKNVIGNLEQKKYDILNKMYVLTGEGYSVRHSDTSRARQIASECEKMFHEAEKIDKALEVLSELECYDYQVSVKLEEISKAYSEDEEVEFETPFKSVPHSSYRNY